MVGPMVMLAAGLVVSLDAQIALEATLNGLRYSERRRYITFHRCCRWLILEEHAIEQ